jgi:hypothetical protein
VALTSAADEHDILKRSVRGQIWCGCGYTMNPGNCDAAVQDLKNQMGKSAYLTPCAPSKAASILPGARYLKSRLTRKQLSREIHRPPLILLLHPLQRRRLRVQPGLAERVRRRRYLWHPAPEDHECLWEIYCRILGPGRRGQPLYRGLHAL